MADQHRCSNSTCPKSFSNHMWGKRQAERDGWFLQRNGNAWCPDHIPDWVDAWRDKKNSEKS